jgi:hypothetical protein
MACPVPGGETRALYVRPEARRYHINELREAFGVRACSPPLSWDGKVRLRPALTPALSSEERENHRQPLCIPCVLLQLERFVG